MDKRYRSMDFLRAVAILLVVLAHSILSYGSPEYLAPLQLGGTGVDLFFVLSGWLLGGLLFKEAEKNNTIDIKRFWARRWMRTIPAYYTVLILTIVQKYITKENVVFPWDYFLFLQNYDVNMEMFFVSWSLCVEEQFYLFIAPLLASLMFLNKKIITTFLLLILLLLPLIFRQMDWFGSGNETHVRVDGCIAGVLLAHIRYQYEKIWSRLTNLAPYFALTGLMLYVFFFIARYNPSLGINDPDKLFLAIIFVTWVLVANADNYWSDRLYIPGAKYIATRSYALYLLHPDMLALMKRFFIEIPFPLYVGMTLVGSLLLSEVLYRVIEKPVMDAREKFSFSKSKHVL